ncbi:MAG: hypothetical protein SGVNAXEH_000624 [Holophagaceae bacterium]
MNNEVVFHDLGPVHYRAGLRIQKLLEEDVQGANQQHLVVLEHNPVFTLGKNANRENLIWTDKFLDEKRIQVFETTRGGDITYHGPGQIVVYPILNLQQIGINLGNFVRGLEESMIRTTSQLGISAQQIKGDSGVWVRTDNKFSKLGAIGLHVSKWITTHGIAFNVSPNLDHYLGINACGFKDRGVASIASLLGDKAPPVSVVKKILISEICQQFGLNLHQPPAPTRSVSVIVFREITKKIEILMMKRVPEDGGWWQSVTGMLDPGESLTQAALREVFEETGLKGDLIDLNYQHTFVIPKERLGKPYLFNTEHCFALRVGAPEAKVVLSEFEHEVYEWASVDRAKDLTPWDGMRIVIDRLSDLLKD